MEKAKVCTKCNGEMVSGKYTGPVIDWEIEGEHAFLKKEGIKITTYACKKCGYMESYVISAR